MDKRTQTHIQPPEHSGGADEVVSKGWAREGLAGRTKVGEPWALFEDAQNQPWQPCSQ